MQSVLNDGVRWDCHLVQADRAVILGVKQVFFTFELLIMLYNGTFYGIFYHPVFTPRSPLSLLCRGTPPVCLLFRTMASLAAEPCVINHQSSGSYTFNPVSQCGLSYTINVTVIQKTTPTLVLAPLYLFVQVRVPELPGTSYGMPVPEPFFIDNQNSSTILTPNPFYALIHYMTVTVNPS